MDYFDGTDNIKEAERDSHGMHVTGLQTGNPDKEVMERTHKRSMVQTRSASYVCCVFQIVKNNNRSALYVC